MTHSRFYAPALQAGDSAVTLPIDEGRHLTRVLRLRIGAPVRVFNGRGLECDGRVVAIGRDEVAIAIDGEATASPETATRITLAQAVLKGDCMDGVIRDAVMMGAAAIVPVLSAHVEGDRRSHASGLRVSRWERIAVVTDVGWIANTMDLFRFLMPAQVRVFPASEKAEARAWIEAT